MYHALISVHILACLMMILIVLLQAGRGAGFNVFGGGGESLFATPTGSSFLKKLTAWMAGTFAVTSLLLTLLQGREGFRSVTNAAAMPVPAAAPAAPSAPMPPAEPAKP